MTTKCHTSKGISVTTTVLNRCHYIITSPELDELLEAEAELQHGCSSVELTFGVRMNDGTEDEITVVCTRVDLPAEQTRAYEMAAAVNGKIDGEPVECAFRIGGEGGFESPL